MFSKRAILINFTISLTTLILIVTLKPSIPEHLERINAIKWMISIAIGISGMTLWHAIATTLMSLAAPLMLADAINKSPKIAQTVFKALLTKEAFEKYAPQKQNITQEKLMKKSHQTSNRNAAELQFKKT